MVTSAASDSFIFSLLGGGIFEIAATDDRLRNRTADTGAFQLGAEARKIACGLRSSSRLEMRAPNPGTSFRANQ
jgi:hypothetical protein